MCVGLPQARMKLGSTSVQNDFAVFSPHLWEVIYRGAKRRCALAIGIIALFVTGSSIFIAMLTKAEGEIVAVMNMSGQQRMLSQRIALYAELFRNASNDETRNQARNMLAAAAGEMASQHQDLYHEGFGSISENLETLLFEEPAFLDQQFHDFMARSSQLADRAIEHSEPNETELVMLIEQAAERLLPALDTAVGIHQEASEATIQRLYLAGLIAGSLTIVLLIALTIGLFRPLCSRLRLAFDELEEAQLQNDRQQSIIREMAYRDPLTNLPNRAGFQFWMEEAMQRADTTHSRISLLLLDLDEFKQVNDSLGHPAGDELLRQVAARLGGCVRATDLLARLGGDEFVIVVADPRDIDGHMALSARLIDAVAKPFLVHDQEIEIGVSIGITCRPRNGLDTDEMLRQADVALYRAKHQGRGVAKAFHDDLDVEIQTRRGLECALRNALECDQLRIVYQPQFDLGSGAIIGFEALLRWRHPDLGDVPPTQFIPIAEATGMITPITSWLLREVCAQLSTWQEQQHGVDAIAINISPKQLRQRDFDEQIRRICGDSEICPSQLEIEITESVLADGDGSEIAMIERIKTLGVRLSIDDFGKGYSSLSRLKSFPIDRLKMDQSFVRDISVSAKDEAVSAAIVRLGQSIGVQVLAEGVERPDQAEILARQGCDQVQGFFYCPPLEVGQLAEFESRLAEGGRKAAFAMS